MTDLRTHNYYKNQEIDNAENSQRNATSKEIFVSRVKLEKQLCDKNTQKPYFYVLPAGGMHLVVPDLEFHNSHFANSSESLNSHSIDMVGDFKEKFNTHENSNSSKMNSSSLKRGDSPSPRVVKLPFGLEITAGPGQKKLEKDGMVKKALPPSQTLLESAAFIKSYFNFLQDKDPPDKDETTNDNEDSVKSKVMGLWHNMKYGKWMTFEDFSKLFVMLTFCYNLH